MFRIRSIRALVEAPPRDVLAGLLRAHASRGLTLTTAGSLHAVVAATGTPPDHLLDAIVARIPARGSERFAFADLLEHDGRRFLVSLAHAPAGTVIELHALEGRVEWKPLLTTLLGPLPWSVTGEDLAWDDARARERVTTLLRGQAEGSHALRDDIAHVLQTPEMRRHLLALRTSHAVLLQADREHDVLTFAGLARKQFALVCSRMEPDAPLMSFEEEPQVRLLFDAKAHCPRCSEAFTSADLRVVYTLTEEGAAATSQPHWLLQPLVKALQERGVPLQPLVLTRAGRSVSLIAYCGGLTVAVQVYDRDVSRDDMLRFTQACLELSVDHVAVATSGTIRPEARKIVEEALAAGPRAESRETGYFEHLTPNGLDPLLSWWSEVADNRLIAHLEENALAPLRAWGLAPHVLARNLVERAARPRERVVTLEIAHTDAERSQEPPAPRLEVVY